MKLRRIEIESQLNFSSYISTICISRSKELNILFQLKYFWGFDKGKY